jgi:hypothetical protein
LNNERRKQINEIVSKLNQCVIELENIRDAEDESRGNMPENLQNSERYSYSEECSDALYTATDCLSDAIDELNNIV